MQTFYENNKQTIHRCLVYVGLVLGIFIFFKYLFGYVAPFVIGFILSLIFTPFVNLLERKIHLPRWAGTTIALLLLFAFFSVVVAGAFTRLGSEAASFWNNLPGYIDSLQQALDGLEITIQNWLSKFPYPIWDSLQLQMPDILRSVGSWISSQSSASGSIEIVLKIPNLLFGFIFTILSAFFFTKDRKEIGGFFQKALPASMMEGYHFTMGSLSNALWGYCKAQLIIMLYIFFICIIGFFVVGSPYAFLLAVITAIVDALPFFGSGFILMPGALIFLLLGNTKLAIGYVIIYLVISLVRQIIQPKILGNQIGLHPIWSLFSLYLGWKLLGVLGLILGPVVAVLIQAISQMPKKEPSKDTPEQEMSHEKGL